MFEYRSQRAYRPSSLSLEKVIDELDTPQARQARIELYAFRAQHEQDLFDESLLPQPIAPRRTQGRR